MVVFSDYVSDKVIHRAKPRNLELKVKNKIWTVSWDPPYGKYMLLGLDYEYVLRMLSCPL